MGLRTGSRDSRGIMDYTGSLLLTKGVPGFFKYHGLCYTWRAVDVGPSSPPDVCLDFIGRSSIDLPGIDVGVFQKLRFLRVPLTRITDMRVHFGTP